MARVLIVSNRLPITVKAENGQLEIERSSGGLATGLQGPHEQSGGLWIGWTGLTEPLPEHQQRELQRQLQDLRLVPVELSAEEVERYYQRFSNGALWPLFHYFVGQLPLDVADYEYYVRVNERFADAVVKHYQPGDLIWVHDYQLMLVPQLIRQRLPNARIGFFLHIPFPSSEVFRTLPNREHLLQGMLGADLVGFHTAAYMRHFASSVLLLLGQATDVDRIRWRRRTVRLGVFPMGVDAQHLVETAEQDAVREQVHVLRQGVEGQVLVGIDRLDYTKGIPRRLLAYERLLLDHPELHGKVRLIQVAVPSRSKVEAYQDFREQVDALIGRIHGAFATANWVPVHYIFRNLAEHEVVSLYRTADLMLVTPIRDGMNLVAKEFVASRVDEGGVLILSEFAGAATELAEAVHVNPYDVVQTAAAYQRALEMPAAERRTRMRALRRRVLAFDVHRWARSFLDQLQQSGAKRLPASEASPDPDIEQAIQRMRSAAKLVLLLDYDGTLVPFANTPELATPDKELRRLLVALAERPHTEVHIVSGRKRENLDEWLGDLPLGLHAEHGMWSRDLRNREWVSHQLGPQEWREPALRILRDFAERTPGTLVEEKTAGVAWHYRMADPEYGAFQANELKLHLTAVLSNSPVAILAGEKVIEVRPHGVNKGLVVAPIAEAAGDSATLVAMGDDRTDEDLFAALPPEGISIHVGPTVSRAKLRILEIEDARALLGALVKG